MQLIILKLNCGSCGLKTEHVQLGSVSDHEYFKCLRCGHLKDITDLADRKEREVEELELPLDDALPCGVG